MGEISLSAEQAQTFRRTFRYEVIFQIKTQGVLYLRPSVCEGMMLPKSARRRALIPRSTVNPWAQRAQRIACGCVVLSSTQPLAGGTFRCWRTLSQYFACGPSYRQLEK